MGKQTAAARQTHEALGGGANGDAGEVLDSRDDAPEAEAEWHGTKQQDAQQAQRQRRVVRQRPSRVAAAPGATNIQPAGWAKGVDDERDTGAEQQQWQ